MYNSELCPQTGVADISATAVSDQTLQEAWSDARIVIKKKELTRSQTRKLLKYLKTKLKKSKLSSEAVKKRALRDIVMLSVALESALRGGDLMSLRLGQLYSSTGKVQREFVVRQQKTKKNVTCRISRKTAKFLEQWKDY